MSALYSEQKGGYRVTRPAGVASIKRDVEKRVRGERVSERETERQGAQSGSGSADENANLPHANLPYTHENMPASFISSIPTPLFSF